mmetsp:Transcript_8250/g.10780  ORF Transcript_8250/g.10780 Transcript_8250/m.10780 type:complete len:204 (+) Transcript_8250:208-819(+)
MLLQVRVRASIHEPRQPSPGSDSLWRWSSAQIREASEQVQRALLHQARERRKTPSRCLAARPPHTNAERIAPRSRQPRSLAHPGGRHPALRCLPGHSAGHSEPRSPPRSPIAQHAAGSAQRTATCESLWLRSAIAIEYTARPPAPQGWGTRGRRAALCGREPLAKAPLEYHTKPPAGPPTATILGETGPDWGTPSSGAFQAPR